jgi:pSer/pThr/pTyr-binding forkhead associated (FHA) protein
MATGPSRRSSPRTPLSFSLQTVVYAQPGAFVVPLTPTNRNLYEDQVLIGRGRHNDIRLLSTDISKSHATFSKGEEGWTLTDLGSSNGTSVNATPLESDRPYRLRPSDEIELAEVAAVFLDPQALVALTTMIK